MNNKKTKEVHYRIKGYFYNQCAYGCSTLAQAMERYNLKRYEIAEWWKEPEAKF